MGGLDGTSPHRAAATILFLCLLLVAQAFFLGKELGAAEKLRVHPGYTGHPGRGEKAPAPAPAPAP
jgi:hypothetical protein